MFKNLEIENFRNIGIMAHIDAGKTTITERILYYTGKLHKIGEVHEGNTAMDWMEQEQERGITITSASTTCFWKKKNGSYSKINIIDTPGHVDFTIEVERSLRVLDGAVAVFDSVAGVESQTETVWKQANNYSVPRICFINKMDKMGSNFDNCLKMISERLNVKPLIMQLPIYSRDNFEGVVDLLNEEAYIWNNNDYKITKIPNDIKKKAYKYKERMIELIVETDEDLMNRYLSGKIISKKDLNSFIRKGVINNKLIPIYCGSAFKNKGIQLLLDAIVNFLPSPIDKTIIQCINTNNNKLTSINFKNDNKLKSLAFKIVNDSFVGSLTYVRIYSGKIKSGTFVFNSNKKKTERIGRILLMNANNREDLTEANTGDIVALVGLKNTITGDTLCDIGDEFILEKINFPEPVMNVALEAKTSKDQDLMTFAISKLVAEDPSLKVISNSETNQTILGGMGELHLEIIVDRMRREFKVNVNMGEPQVAYRETLTKPFEVDYTHKKQSGGAGQFARVKMMFEPQKSGSGFSFINKIIGGSIPKEYIPAIEKSILNTSKNGIISGHPFIDFKVTLIDGSYHDVDSSSLAFEIAAKTAFHEGAKRSSIIVLEPIMNVEIFTPKDYLGNIISHVNSIRGKVISIFSRHNDQVIISKTPLSTMFGFVNHLRSLSKGRAQYSMKFNSYAKMPTKVAEKIIK